MKQKVFSLSSDYAIRGEAGNVVAWVRGKVFSLGDKLSFQDPSGNELLRIQRTVLSWGPTYQIHRDGALSAILKKDLFTFFGCKFTLDGPGDYDLEVKGDFLDHEYSFLLQDREVASVSKKWFSWSDTYGVDIAEGQDNVLILAATVIIDLACHNHAD